MDFDTFTKDRAVTSDSIFEDARNFYNVQKFVFDKDQVSITVRIRNKDTQEIKDVVLSKNFAKPEPTPKVEPAPEELIPTQLVEPVQQVEVKTEPFDKVQSFRPSKTGRRGRK